MYEEVKKIPSGQTRTYKEIADLILHPYAFRAVGSALNKNTDSEVPCHRVVRSDGKIGGYRGGSGEKERILRKEGAIR
ncbi:MAG: MGMT family protein [bacterium]|nr:MGMT family protein [bacterium]